MDVLQPESGPPHAHAASHGGGVRDSLLPLLTFQNYALELTGTIAADYWNHSIATELNPAPAGSDILRDLGLMNALKAWLEPLKFVGMAILFSGIALALVTVVKVLQAQTQRITEIVASAKSS